VTNNVFLDRKVKAQQQQSKQQQQQHKTLAGAGN